MAQSTSSVKVAEGANLGPVPRPVPSRIPLLLKIVLSAILVMFVAECLRIFVGSNFHTVVPGKCYRSAQPTAAFLENIQRTHGICTIINLRDENEDEPWYREEKHAALRLNVKLVNAGLRQREQPPEVDFHTFVRAMKDSPEPILIHAPVVTIAPAGVGGVSADAHEDADCRGSATSQLTIWPHRLEQGVVSASHSDNYEDWLAESRRA